MLSRSRGAHSFETILKSLSIGRGARDFGPSVTFQPNAAFLRTLRDGPISFGGPIPPIRFAIDLFIGLNCSFKETP
jgi:hypothetical protein